jgi:hypothetical protein
MHACVWIGGAITALDTSSTASWATAISPDGNVIVGDIATNSGSYGSNGSQGTLAVWTKSGSNWLLSEPVPVYLSSYPGSGYPNNQFPYNRSEAYAINSNYLIGGSVENTGAQQYACTVTPGGTFTDLQGEGHAAAMIRGVNDSGMVVGYDSSTPFVNFTGTVGNNVTLTSVLATGQGTGWTPYYAYGCDNTGDIVGFGKVGSTYYAYLMTPVPTPEPSTLLLAASGLVGLLAYAWRKRK